MSTVESGIDVRLARHVDDAGFITVAERSTPHGDITVHAGSAGVVVLAEIHASRDVRIFDGQFYVDGIDVTPLLRALQGERGFAQAVCHQPLPLPPIPVHGILAVGGAADSREVLIRQVLVCPADRVVDRLAAQIPVLNEWQHQDYVVRLTDNFTARTGS